MKSDVLAQTGRDFLVRSLILDSLEKLQSERLSLWLHGILENGFAGFANMKDAELLRECRRRGLRLEEPLEEAPLEEFDDDPDEDEDDLLELLPMRQASGAAARS